MDKNKIKWEQLLNESVTTEGTIKLIGSYQQEADHDVKQYITSDPAQISWEAKRFWSNFAVSALHQAHENPAISWSHP